MWTLLSEVGRRRLAQHCGKGAAQVWSWLLAAKQRFGLTRASFALLVTTFSRMKIAKDTAHWRLNCYTGITSKAGTLQCLAVLWTARVISQYSSAKRRQGLQLNGKSSSRQPLLYPPAGAAKPEQRFECTRFVKSICTTEGVHPSHSVQPIQRIRQTSGQPMKIRKSISE